MNQDASPQQLKSTRSRQAICTATIDTLVAVGYSETTLNRVASTAGLSKGALQYHFPSKEDLIAATVDVLLLRTFQPQSKLRQPLTVDQALLDAWTRFINTPAYRALMEILNAARTDQNLQLRISDDLKNWGRKMDEQSLANYEAVSGDEDEVIMLLNMSRSFMRGLLLQERYGADPAKTTLYVKRWIAMVSPLLRLRETCS